MRDIVLSGRQFTWASRRQVPTYEKLDRVLSSIGWEQKFPLVSVRALTRSGSDHTPLFIDSGDQAHLGNRAQFSFELSWLREEGFYDIIAAEWASVNSGRTPIERWQNKIRHLRRFLRGWAKNLSGKYKKERDHLLKIIDDLDIKAESVDLTMAERATLRDANDFVSKLRWDEDSKWAQRGKAKYIQEGGSNTKFFILLLMGSTERKRYFNLSRRKGPSQGRLIFNSISLNFIRNYLELWNRILSPWWNPKLMIYLNFLRQRMPFSWRYSPSRKCMMPSSRWNITKRPVLMVFLRSSISFPGTLLI